MTTGNLANPTMEDLFGPVIYSYSRAQALEDGMLVDVSELAREMGFRFPVAITASVWAQVGVVPETVPWQSTEGRLWDLRWMLFNAIRRAQGHIDEVHFVVLIDNGEGPKEERFWAKCGPGDDFEPVITVMQEGED